MSFKTMALRYNLCLQTDMLKAHFDAVERALLAMGDVSGNAGHNLHIGTPREWLLRTFLDQHLPTISAVGTGEIISADATPNDDRNQFDLVVYRREQPRLDYGGGISAFLIESVQATIEIKSTASYEQFKTATFAAKRIKELRKSVMAQISFGVPLPSPVSYFIAYDGPQSLNTVWEWIDRIKREETFSYPSLPPAQEDRVRVQCTGLDAVFILGKGFLYFDNVTLGWLSPAERANNPHVSWLWANQTQGNLLYFFLLLNTVVSGFHYQQINPVEYMRGVGLPHLSWGI